MDYVWQEYPETSLVLVGKGDLDVDLRSCKPCEKVPTARLNFWAGGMILMKSCRYSICLFLPSLNEGMGRVLVEAMAAGKPVVASRVGGIPDLVRHGETGYLVPPADEKALADGIKKLLDDPGKAWEMGQQGRKLCQQFSLEAMIEKLDDLYSDLIIIRQDLLASARAQDWIDFFFFKVSG